MLKNGLWVFDLSKNKEKLNKITISTNKIIPSNINHTVQIKKFETIFLKLIIIFLFFPDVFQIISVKSNQISKVSLHPKKVFSSKPKKMSYTNLHQWLLKQIFLQIQIFLQWSPFKKLMKWTVMFVHKRIIVTILDQIEAFVFINLKSNVNPICGKKKSV